MPRTRKKAEPTEAANPDRGQEMANQEPTPRKRRSTSTRSRKTSPRTCATADTSEATVPLQAEAVEQRLRDLAGQLEEMSRQTVETWAQLGALRDQRHQATRELETYRHQAEAAQQQFLQEILASTQRVREEVAATEGQLREVARVFHEAGQHLQVLPRQAIELQRQFDQMKEQLPVAQEQVQTVEQEAASTRQDLATIEKESREARGRLDDILQETAAAEVRLASVRSEFEQAESRLRCVQQQLERVTEEVYETEEKAEEVAASIEEIDTGTNRLGVTVDPGVVVAEVLSGSPAETAGLVRGDLISGVNGTPVFTGIELRDLIQAIPDGEEVTLQVTRGSELAEIKAQLAAVGKSSEGQDRLGVTVEPGVVVAEVLLDSAAFRAGLMRGDVINTINDTAVLTGEQLRQAVASLPPRAEVRLQVSHSHEVREVEVRLDEVPMAPALSETAVE